MDAQGCSRKGKWFGGCRFEPRYDVGEPDTSKLGKVEHYLADAAEIVQACRPSTYIHDVCVRCGKIAAPPPPTIKET